MDKLTLKGEKRQITGRKVKQLRSKGLVPANVYGNKVESIAVQIDNKLFEKVYREAGETKLIELTIENEKRPVLVHHLQKNPVTDQLLHVDFHQVDLKQKVTANVPVELINESPAEKQGIGTAVQQITEIEVEALPGDLPEKFEIDLANLDQIDQMVQIKDLKVDKAKVEIMNGEDEIIVKIEPPKEEVEEPVVATEDESSENQQEESNTDEVQNEASE